MEDSVCQRGDVELDVLRYTQPIQTDSDRILCKVVTDYSRHHVRQTGVSARSICLNWLELTNAVNVLVVWCNLTRTRVKSTFKVGGDIPLPPPFLPFLFPPLKPARGHGGAL